MGFVVWLQSVMTENDAAIDTDIFPSGWSSDILVPAMGRLARRGLMTGVAQSRELGTPEPYLADLFAMIPNL